MKRRAFSFGAAVSVLPPLQDSPSGMVDTVVGDGNEKPEPSTGAGQKVCVGQPFGLAVGPDGWLYFTEVSFHRVRRWNPKDGRVETVAGRAQPPRTGGYSGDGKSALRARLNEPYEVAFDDAGALFWVEMQNHLVRKRDKTGVVSTVAGTGAPGFDGDGGPATTALFRQPHSLAIVGRTLFVADISNHRIRAVNLTTGVVTTAAGDGRKVLPKDGQLAKGNPILGPRALAPGKDCLWIALREGHSVWRLDLQSGKLHHVAGDGKPGFVDGKAGRFDGPKGLAVGPGGLLYVADTENHAIRRVDPRTGEVATLAGGGPQARGFAGDGGPGRAAQFDRPHGVAVDSAGVVYIGDSSNHRIRRWRPSS